MTPNTISASQAIQQANEAFHRGDKRAARQWAQMAASIAPHSEDAWLILAAVSTPQASVVYLKQALIVNPGSERALRGLRWAQDRLARQTPTPRPQPKLPVTAPLAVTQLTQTQAKSSAAPRKTSGARMVAASIIFLTLIISVVLILSLWPGNVSRALALFGSEVTATVTSPIPTTSTRPTKFATGGPSWSGAEIAKPTYTPTATVTTIPTVTTTPTALPTDGPTAENTAAPAAQAPDRGKYVLVSISEQHLYAYQDNQLVYSFVASTGINNGTRTGVFQVLDKIPNAYGATWDLWMPNWMGIYYSGTLENGIHALPILSNGAQLWAGYLGTPISFGCVVLGVEEAQLLYDWAEVGTTVEIRY